MKKITLKNMILLFTIMLLTSGINVAYALNFPTHFQFKFQDFEYFNPNQQPEDNVIKTDGYEDNWGIASMTSIFEATDYFSQNPYWQTGDDGEQVRIFFYGLDLAYWYTSGAYGMTPISTGAYLEMYLWDKDDLGYVQMEANIANRSGTSYHTVTDGGQLLAKFEFTYGVSSDQNIVAAGTTNTFTNPPNGEGAAFLKVIPNSGSMANTFDTDSIINVLNEVGIAHNPSWIDPEADIYLHFNFEKLNNSNSGFHLFSHDPGYGAVPEPATLVLMGTGFLFAGALGRKKYSKKE